MRLTARLIEKPWGVDPLPDWLGGDAGRRIGEIWYESGEAPPPLLIKHIFASEKLSVQVHPDDADARARGHPHGKSEGWYIVDAGPGAVLGLGTHADMTDEALAAAARDGSIEDRMRWYPVRRGDYFWVPAGTVHAIGPGVGLVEVQRNIDITYRLYDYGRPRELHLEDGVAVAFAHPFEAENRVHVGPGPGLTPLPAGDGFAIHHARGPFDPAPLGKGGPWFCVPVEGEVAIAGETFACGSCALVADLEALDVPEAAALIIADASRLAP